MNKTLFKFHRKYFFSTLLLFATEIFIAAYLHDAVIRPYGGDFLVVILIYCFMTVRNQYQVLSKAAIISLSNSFSPKYLRLNL